MKRLNSLCYCISQRNGLRPLGRYIITWNIEMLYFYLEENIKDNYQERPEEVEEEPLLNGFDIKGDREVL